ncbi:MAG: hypothetical protein ATN35_05625 [Epulopiscium sp. Nele67-Bin004]|nr:MAG: hypothetical protein ATN35_05625 [Epulopiscium sp. Nele67-Bin004]
MMNNKKLFKVGTILVVMGAMVYMTGSLTQTIASIEEKHNLEPFQKLYVDTSGVNFQIVEGNEYNLELDIKSTRQVEFNNKNNMLEVKTSSLSQNFFGLSFFSFLFNNDKEQDLIVLTIPTDSEFEVVELSTGSGNLNADKIVSDKIVFDISSGSVVVDEIETKDIEVDGSSGSFKVNSLITDTMNVDYSSGSVRISNIEAVNAVCKVSSGSLYLQGDFSESVKATSSSGSVQVELDKGYNDYNYMLKASSGKVTVNGDNWGNMSNVTGDKPLVDVSVSAGIARVNTK